ncbi:unnamed protein product [Urochloa humidicola]
MRRMFFRHSLPCILLLLLMSHLLPSSILGLRTLREEKGCDLRRQHEPEIAPAISPSQEVAAAAAAASKYAVSRRMVPQGPNPLHNR